MRRKQHLMTASVVSLIAGAAISFAIAGTWLLPFFWIVFLTQGITSIAGIYLLDPGLIAERIRPAGKDMDPFGPIIITILFLAIVGIASLDVGRWHLTDFVPVSIQVMAAILHGIGWAGFTWTMYINRFFSSAIRLQPDRQQEVVAKGPYKWVRHPGYLFASLAIIAQCLALGSFLSLIPGILVLIDLIYRTQLEERILNQGLDGYQDYSQRVRFKWVPGIW